MPIDIESYAKKVEDEIERFLTKVLLKIESDSVRIIDSNKANAWGEMRRNVTSEVYREAARIVGVVGVRSNVPYAIFRHEGTKPHWPPQIAIQQWVIRKGIIKMNKKPVTLGKLRGTKKSVSDPLIREIIRISFLIARKISKKGTKGLPFLRMALNQNRSWIEGELKNLKLS
jgi:hypothetical protein